MFWLLSRKGAASPIEGSPIVACGAGAANTAGAMGRRTSTAASRAAAGLLGTLHPSLPRGDSCGRVVVLALVARGCRFGENASAQGHSSGFRHSAAAAPAATTA